MKTRYVKMASAAGAFQIHPFDTSRIPNDAFCVSIGKRRSGKTSVCKAVLYEKRHKIDDGVVFTGTIDGADDWDGPMPATFVYDGFQSSYARKIRLRQRYRLRYAKLHGQSRDSVRPTLVIFDDCLADNAFSRDREVRTLAMNGRHYKAFVWANLQYLIGFPPAVRTQVDYVFLFYDSSRNNLKQVYLNWFSMVPTFEQFLRIVEEICQPFTCLVLDNTVNARDCSNMYWYRARYPLPRFRFGNKAFWEYHYRHRRTRDQELAELERDMKTLRHL